MADCIAPTASSASAVAHVPVRHAVRSSSRLQAAPHHAGIAAPVCMDGVDPPRIAARVPNGLPDGVDRHRGPVPVCGADWDGRRRPRRVRCGVQPRARNAPEPAVPRAAAPFLAAAVGESADTASGRGLPAPWAALAAAASIPFRTPRFCQPCSPLWAVGFGPHLSSIPARLHPDMHTSRIQSVAVLSSAQGLPVRAGFGRRGPIMSHCLSASSRNLMDWHAQGCRQIRGSSECDGFVSFGTSSIHTQVLPHPG